MNKVYLSLGSNTGDRLGYLFEAINRISSLADTYISSISSFYFTHPFGKTGQPNFINTAIMLETTIGPEELLGKLQSIESNIGRVRKEKWGPRVIDIDIVLFGEKIINTENLIIPHPGLYERDFFIYPLLEIDPGLIVPGENKYLSSIADKLKETYIFEKFFIPLEKITEFG